MTSAALLAKVVFVAGDYVIRQGEFSSGMVFVSAGQVEVLSVKSGEERLITVLGDHSRRARRTRRTRRTHCTRCTRLTCVTRVAHAAHAAHVTHVARVTHATRIAHATHA